MPLPTTTKPTVPNLLVNLPHRKIKTKAITRAYDTLEVFDLDVRSMFIQEPLLSAGATSIDLGEVGGGMAHGDSSESQGPTAEEGIGREGATAKRRKEALTAEFAARLEIDRADVESVIRARDTRRRVI